jgi:hypothetical protein
LLISEPPSTFYEHDGILPYWKLYFIDLK